MSKLARDAAILLSTILQIAGMSHVRAESSKVERLETSDGEKVAGRLEGDAERGFRFVTEAARATHPLDAGMTIHFAGEGPPSSAGAPPFRADLGLNQQLWGRLVSVDEKELRLGDVTGENSYVIARGGMQSLTQRPGESLVLQDGFEGLQGKRWTIQGKAEIVDDPRFPREKCLRLAASGGSASHVLAEPIRAGRLELAFRDDGLTAAASWTVELIFRGAAGPEPVRILLGWAEETLAVESPNGPALAVQRLARKAGWHRLGVRFVGDSAEISVDENELAHGKGFGGPLVQMTLVSRPVAKDADEKIVQDVAGLVDDVRLIRFSQSRPEVEEDVTQDEVRLDGGDQVFGKILSADGECVSLLVAGQPVRFSWGEISGLHFRRVATPASPVEGLLARVTWRSSSTEDPSDWNVLQGAIVKAGPTSITLATPYAGTLILPRDRLKSVVILGRGRRIVVDPMAHHLGDEISSTPPMLDPRQPEGGVLERAVDLPELPRGPAWLVLDVVQVVGENAEIPTFSDMVKRGELRTNVKLNGEPFDYLNRHVKDRNETPEQIRIPIPRALLKVGKNVIRLEQSGTSNDPNYLDDLGILGIAIDFQK